MMLRGGMYVSICMYVCMYVCMYIYIFCFKVKESTHSHKQPDTLHENGAKATRF